MQGMELCRRFYHDCVEGILARRFPGLEYACGLLGFGSDVLGYDDEVSHDHMWGPRLYIFLNKEDMAAADMVMAALCSELPRRFMGFPVGFGAPGEDGISAMQDDDSGQFRPMISIDTLDGFLMSELGVAGAQGLSAADWLALSEHKLLTLRAGELFHDDIGAGAVLCGFDYYPDDVWLYLIMSDWACIAEERAFVKRTASRGDDMGSRIICARIAHRAMHLCFLYERRYAPYAKWMGTAFAELASARAIAPMMRKALETGDMLVRERALAGMQSRLIELHNASGLTPPVDSRIAPYFTRDILVADSDGVCNALRELIKGTQLEGMPPLGSMSGVGNLVELSEHAAHFERRRSIYE